MKPTKLLLSLLILAFFSNPIFSQQLNYAADELIVQLDKSTNAIKWLKKINRENEILALLDYERVVSTPLNIHRYSFDDTKIDVIRMLEAVQNTEGIVLAQFNHFLELRQTIPDDPQFVDQWQYINTGQDGGTVGADIDADLAWDIATGGLTPEGDTIVVCVIDGGFQITHPDLRDNVWFNYAEIPNNGIDDDNNGFVDDFKGWSTGSQSDAVDAGPTGHGTPVAGIVGAKGNNGTGVAGVNWDVKVMLVQGGSGVESEVLEAYSYALEARIRYNETDGAEGAFVVSTNASWGVDFGQPANAPIWCAFYDSLGVHGIVSCGATINGNQNVDVIGDLPTACPSDYLISVTNMNRNDEKVTSAGYGLETIDIGAFGQDTWTISSGNSYGDFGGTSGATPHVSGAIALLYAAPCSNLTALAKADPAQAALQVKQLVLETGDDNTSLDGITTSGKRLNLNNMMLTLMNNCGPCPNPVGLRANDLTDVNASLVWTTSQNTMADTLRWREEGDSVWTTIFPATSPTSLSNLMACSFYEFQVVSNCDTISSDPSTIQTFKTDGCCELPSEINLTNLEEESATISWNSILAAESYNLRYRESTATNWTEVAGLNMTSLNLENLVPCTEYVYQIQVVCANELIEYGAEATFKTLGCGPCLDLNYCPVEDMIVVDEWINTFEVGGINNASGDDGGYGDYTNSAFTTTFETYGIYEFTFAPGYESTVYDENIRIWIDFNGDGNFSDAERVIEDNDITSSFSGLFQIPGTATPGFVRMRVGMYFGNITNPCTGGAFGEVEDYCVTIVQGVPQCNEVANILFSAVSENSALISWTTTTGAQSYLLRYKDVNATTWTEVTSPNNSNNTLGLSECTDYEVQVKTICDGVESDFTEVEIFSTECSSSTIDASHFEAIEVFPSPFEDNLNLSFQTDKLLDNITISLLNELGQTVITEQLQNTGNQTYNIQLQTNDLPEGLYFLRMESGLNNKIVKVIKTNR